jgi:hypothetical protein
MKAGPPRAELGIASCPTCGDAVMRVATNKHGYPCAYCKTCDTQVAPRAELGSLKLLGRIHTWNNPEAAELMLTADDRTAMAGGGGKLPPHLARLKSTSTAPRPSSKPKPSSAPTTSDSPPKPAPATPPAPATKPWWDQEIG